MERDVAAELVDVLRALPEHVALVCDSGPGPEDGLLIAIPEDRHYRLELIPAETGWQLDEVWQPGPLLGEQRTWLGTCTTAEAPAKAARHFHRLQLQCRNAACGTPVTSPRSSASRP